MHVSGVVTSPDTGAGFFMQDAGGAWSGIFVYDGYDVDVELGSDQTSLHIPYTGGYYPAGMTYDESNAMMAADPAAFKERVRASLLRHIAAVNACVEKGMRFWDYGNAFLLEASRAGARDRARLTKRARRRGVKNAPSLNRRAWPDAWPDVTGHCTGASAWYCGPERSASPDRSKSRAPLFSKADSRACSVKIS